MDSCVNIGYVNYENICINCGTIHDYKYINEIYFKDYNMNMSNILFYKKFVYKRKKYLYNMCLRVNTQRPRATRFVSGAPLFC